MVFVKNYENVFRKLYCRKYCRLFFKTVFVQNKLAPMTKMMITYMSCAVVKFKYLTVELIS